MSVVQEGAACGHDRIHRWTLREVLVRLEGADAYTCTRGPNKGRKRWKRPLQNKRVVWLKKEEYQAVWREAKAQEEASHG